MWVTVATSCGHNICFDDEMCWELIHEAHAETSPAEPVSVLCGITWHLPLTMRVPSTALVRWTQPGPEPVNTGQMWDIRHIRVVTMPCQLYVEPQFSVHPVPCASLGAFMYQRGNPPPHWLMRINVCLRVAIMFLAHKWYGNFIIRQKVMLV